MPLLFMEKGPEKGRSVNFAQQMTIGRESENELKIPENSVSRRHCKIYLKNGCYYIEDLNSLNGTQVNGQFITQPTPLKEGDQISVGETVLVWQEKQQKDPLIGQELGGYQIIQRLGKGGMGTVYLAKQMSLDREVALKILDSKIAKDNTFVRRFLDEARACATLNHPNIIQIYDAGEAQGYFYFSMEYAKGGSVQNLIAGGKSLTWQEAMPLILDTAAGLEYAEKKKIVHRDIKPDNLMLTEEKRVKIVDLGLARRFDRSPTSEEQGIYGTPYYVAPEQVQGLPVDHRTDIYAFGASCYRIFAGHTPFQGNSVLAILQKNLHEMPPPLKEVIPDFPLVLSNLIVKMMQKNPEDRCSSNAEVIQTIRDFMQSAEKMAVAASAAHHLSTRRTSSLNRTTMSIAYKDMKRRQTKKDIWHQPIFWVIVGAVFFLIAFGIGWEVQQPTIPTIDPNQVAQTAYQGILAKYQQYGPSIELINASDAVAKKYANTVWGNKAQELTNQIRQKWAEQQKQKAEEQQSQEQYKIAQQYERDNPEDWPNILQKYQDIADQLPFTTFGKLAQKDAERCRREISATKDQLWQKFRTLKEELEQNISEDNFIQAHQSLVKFEQEIKDCDDETLLEQVPLRHDGLNKKIAAFVEEAQKAIRENAPQNMEVVQTWMEKLRKNKELPVVATALQECETYLKNLPPPPPKVEVPIVLSSEYAQKLEKFCSDYEFAEGSKYFQQALPKATADQKKMLEEIVQDLRSIDAMLQKANTQWQKKPIQLSQEAQDAVKQQLKALHPDDILIQGVDKGKFQLKIVMSGQLPIMQKIAMKNFSSDWIYTHILHKSLSNNRDSTLGLTLYCYYCRLYQDAWNWTEKLIQQGQKDNAQRLKNKLQAREQAAHDIYYQEIMPLYQRVKLLRDEWQKTTQPEMKSGLQQKLSDETKNLQNRLNEFLQEYQYTRFAIPLNEKP